LIQSTSCDKSRKRSKRTESSSYDLIDRSFRFVDGVFSGFPTKGPIPFKSLKRNVSNYCSMVAVAIAVSGETRLKKNR
jgi:hypothetical protein